MSVKKSESKNIKVEDTLNKVSHLRNESENLVCGILSLSDSLTQSQIVKKLNVDKSKVSRVISKAIADGLIVEKFPGSKPKFYRLTGKGVKALKKTGKNSRFSQFSMGASQGRGGSDLHDFKVKFPIVLDKEYPNLAWDKVNTKFSHWVPKYKKIPGSGVTIQKTPDNIILMFSGEKFDNTVEGVNSQAVYIAKILRFSQEFLLNKMGVLIDLDRGQVVSQHIAHKIPEYDNAVGPGVSASVDLGRKADSLLGLTDIDAKAWIDRSDGPLEVESNTLDYTTKLILMPEMVSRINDSIPVLERAVNSFSRDVASYSENIRLHLSVLSKMADVLEKIEEKIGGSLGPGLSQGVAPTVQAQNYFTGSGDSYRACKEFWDNRRCKNGK